MDYSYTIAPAGFGCDGGFLNTVEQLAAADNRTWRTDRHPTLRPTNAPALLPLIAPQSDLTTAWMRRGLLIYCREPMSNGRTSLAHGITAGVQTTIPDLSVA